MSDVMSALGGVEQVVLDAGRQGPLTAASLDKGTFPWYKRDNGGRIKSLILLALRALPDNPFLGIIKFANAIKKMSI
jgi:hypothetical protein